MALARTPSGRAAASSGPAARAEDHKGSPPATAAPAAAVPPTKCRRLMARISFLRVYNLCARNSTHRRICWNRVLRFACVRVDASGRERNNGSMPNSAAQQTRPDEFAGLFARFFEPPVAERFALAVSGGSDSTALMVLFADWLRQTGKSTSDHTVLTVDHRPAARVRRPRRARSVPARRRSASVTPSSPGMDPSPRPACRPLPARRATTSSPSTPAPMVSPSSSPATPPTTRPRRCSCGSPAAAVSTVSPPWRR